MDELLLIAAASMLAGCIDAMVGGGGLVLLPALFAVYPGAAPVTLFGTNKGAAIWGTALAALQFARRINLRTGVLVAGMAAALAGSLGGAWLATQADPLALRRALPLVLLGVLVYTLMRKDLGQKHALRFGPGREAMLMALIALILGAYDGFFGPGTGSFLVFLLVRVLGYDFLHASAGAKAINTATNAAALLLFGWKGHVWWHLAAVLALANVAGSLLGTRLALKHGSGLVRIVFIAVVGALIVKTAWDAYV